MRKGYGKIKKVLLGVLLLAFVLTMPGGVLAHDPYNEYYGGGSSSPWTGTSSWWNYNFSATLPPPENGDYIYIQTTNFYVRTATYDLTSTLNLAEIDVWGLFATLDVKSSGGGLTTNVLNVTSSGGVTLDLGSLTAGSLSIDSSGVFQLNKGSLVTTTTSLGMSNSSPVTFTQSGGTHTVGGLTGSGGSLNVGSGLYTAGQGSYALQYGTLDVYGTIYVGRGVNVQGFSPTGDFSQGIPGRPNSGGSVVIHYTPPSPCVQNCVGAEGDGGLHIGYAGGSGTYTLNYGQLTVGGNLYLDNGTFTQGMNGDPQSGGAVTIGTQGAYYYSGDLSVGGTYILYNGTLNSRTTSVGGQIHQYGGVHTVGPNPYSGGSVLGVNGTYNLTSGNLVVNGDTSIATSSPSPGGTVVAAFNQGYDGINKAVAGDGGTVTVNGNLYIGSWYPGGGLPSGFALGTGQYNLYNGTLRVTGDLNIGPSSSGGVSGPGQFTHTGGSVIASNLFLGSQYGGTGTYTLSGDPMTSTLTVTGTTWVGAVLPNPNPKGTTGAGAFTQQGGTHSTSSLKVGNFGPGTYTLSGDPSGSILNVTGGTTLGGIGPKGYVAGTFIQQGGTHTTPLLTINRAGTYNLQGGVLRVLANGSGIIQNNGAFTFTGGTLDADQFQNTGGIFTVSGPAAKQIGADVDNAGGSISSFQNATVTFGGTFTLNGAMYTDPSTITFNKDVIIGTTGFINAKGDTFIFNKNFMNNSADTADWNTSLATIIFTGGGSHHFAPGNNPAFKWGTLDLEGTDQLYLDSGSLYVSLVHGLNIVNGVITNVHGGTGIYLYFDPLLNQGLGQYALADGGFLLPAGQNPVPIPGALWLFGSGLAGLAATRRRFKK